MIIQYTNNKILFNVNELAKVPVLIAANSVVLFIAKTLYSNLAVSSESFYKSDCISPTDSICCFTSYTRMESSNLLNSCIDKIGGVFAFTSVVFLIKGGVPLTTRAIKHYMN